MTHINNRSFEVSGLINTPKGKQPIQGNVLGGRLVKFDDIFLTSYAEILDGQKPVSSLEVGEKVLVKFFPGKNETFGQIKRIL